MASEEDTRTSMSYMAHLRSIALAGVRLIEEKTRTYGPSWKRRRGPGAWFTTVRPWDRLETIVDRHDGDVFAAIEAQPMGEDGSALACIRDMRNYLLLIEAEMVARGTISGPALEPEESLLATLKTTLERLFGNGAPHMVERLVQQSSHGATTLALHFAPPRHHTQYDRQMACQDAVLGSVMTVEEAQDLAERQTDRARDAESPLDGPGVVTQDTQDPPRGMGAGPVADGRYTILDLGQSSELWAVGLGAVPSPYPGGSDAIFGALCTLAEASDRLVDAGALVASRRLDCGDHQVLIRIPCSR